MKVKKQKDTKHINEDLNKKENENVRALISNFNEKIKKNEFRLNSDIRNGEVLDDFVLSDEILNPSPGDNGDYVKYENCVRVSDLLSKKPEYEKVMQKFENILMRPHPKFRLDSQKIKNRLSNNIPSMNEAVSVNFKLPVSSEKSFISESESSSFLSKEYSNSTETSETISSEIQIRSLNISNSNNRRGTKESVVTTSSQATEKSQSSANKSSVKSSSCCTSRRSSLLGIGWKYFNLMRLRLCSKSVKINKDFL